jgi:hypothetical protein
MGRPKRKKRLKKHINSVKELQMAILGVMHKTALTQDEVAQQIIDNASTSSTDVQLNAYEYLSSNTLELTDKVIKNVKRQR